MKRIHIYFALPLLLLLGILLSLSFRFIKYTEFIDPKIKNIDPSEAYSKILQNPEKIVLIDVRSQGEYLKVHASSSVNLPIHYMYDDTHGLDNELKVPLPKNKDQEIYLLCTGGRLAGVAYSYLEHYGYRNIKRVDGGINNWAKQGLPLVSQDLFNLKETSYSSNDLDRPYVQTKGQ